MEFQSTGQFGKEVFDDVEESAIRENHMLSGAASGDQMSASGASQSESRDDIRETVEPRSAIDHMQILAQRIYETTPGIAKCKLQFWS